MSNILIPTGRWKVNADSANDQSAIRLSGRAFTDGGRTPQQLQTVVLTREQARELVAELYTALHELDLQRTASLARLADGEGASGQWKYSL
jgi:hypothetical protein